MIDMRIYGLDLLRILSAVMIIILHILGRGGILYNTAPLSLNYEIVWLLEISCFCAVNCYGLISGYVLSDKEIRYNRIIKSWFQVTFYTVGITIVFFIVDPSMINIKNIIKSVLPLYTGQYWYFTAYVGMAFFIPFLNHFIQIIEKQRFKKLLLMCGILFSFLPTLFLGKLDPFYLNNGYSMLWLIILYLLGAYCKKYNVASKFKEKRLLLRYLMCIAITWIIKLIIEVIIFKILGKVMLGNILISYISPPIILSSIYLFLYFTNLKIQKKSILKVIKFLSPLTFGIYLIHANPLIYTYIFNNMFIKFINYPFYSIIVYIAIFTSIIFLVCVLIDKIRMYIFKIINVDKISIKIMTKASDLFEKIIIEILT